MQTTFGNTPIYIYIYIDICNSENIDTDGYNEGDQYSVEENSAKTLSKIPNKSTSAESDLTFSIQLSQLSQLVGALQNGQKAPYACSDTA